jgi:amino acid transporter
MEKLQVHSMLVYFLIPDGKKIVFLTNFIYIYIFFLFLIKKRNYLNNAIDDLKDPKRILPRSIVISLLICIFIYFLTFSSYFTALSAYDILISDATAVSFAERVFTPLLYIIPFGVTMSCVGGK